MILRAIAILLAGLATAALWYSYDELTVFRRTAFWDYRYIIFTVGAFLGLGAVEWALGWVKTKTQGTAGDQ
jgi:hypothetical protein